MDLKEPCGRVKRWAMRLSSMNCRITYRRGVQNVVADALSRAPIIDTSTPHETFIDKMIPIHENEECNIKFDPDITTTSTAKIVHQCKRCSDNCPKENAPITSDNKPESD